MGRWHESQLEALSDGLGAPLGYTFASIKQADEGDD